MSIGIDIGKYKIKIVELEKVNDSVNIVKADSFSTFDNLEKFDLEKINSLYSNLSSLTIWELYKLKKDYVDLGYSSIGINTQIQKIISFPLYVALMTIIATIVMLNIKRNKSKIFHIILGILFSALIYYINYFSALLGENEKLPEVLSIWLPLIIISLFCTIGLVNINEK